MCAGRTEAKPSALMASYLEGLGRLRRALTLRTGSRDLAEEAVQETWFRLNRELPGQILVRDRQAYILMVAANIATDIIRRERRHLRGRAMDAALLDTVLDERPSAETRLIDRERLKHLVRALAELSPKAREVLILNRCAGLGHREIAARLAISESMVAKYMAQALRHCRAHFRAADQQPAGQRAGQGDGT